MIQNKSIGCLAAGVMMLGVVLAAAPPAPAGDAPALLRVEVYLKAGGRPVRGMMTAHDDAGLTIKSGDGESHYDWVDLVIDSAYQVRLKTIDRKQASDWFDLGKFAWDLGGEKQAKAAFAQAAKLDADLRARADEILATPAGSAVAAAKKPADPADGAGEGTGDNTGAKPAAAPPAQPGRQGKAGKVTTFQPATPEQAEKALARARANAKEAESAVNVKLADFETDHFLVFTDWDPAEYDFLKKNVEAAYKCVAKQFDMDPAGNVFVGKLPIYMFTSKTQFQSFSDKIDGFPTTDAVLGYYNGTDDGVGHMAMWKPASGNGVTLAAAEREWAYVLTHEFTHAFIARYRTNARIPRWMNEGIAEVIAGSQFPKPENRRWARMMATQTGDISFLFDDEKMPTGDYYPVMMTMVETLANGNRKAFLKLFNDIKDGADPKDALKTNFKIDYDGLVNAWRRYARNIT